MVERAKAAIIKTLDDYWDWHAREFVDGYEEAVARAVIAAMREPTEAMVTRGERESIRDGAHDCEVPMSDIWRAMSDDALK
jgi:hypothetical protein